jgi:hypothetical protein
MDDLTVIPTMEPTAFPTTTSKPTYAPTQMTSPIILFSSNLTMNTILNSPVLDTKSQHTLINVSAWSMKVTENTITYKNGIITTSSNRRNLRSRITLFTTTYTIIASIQATIPLKSTAYTDPTLLYNSMTSSLTNSVKSGTFTKQLQKMSIVFNATQTAKANVTYVSNSALIVNDIIYVSPVSIEGVSAVSVILMTTAIFIVICGLYTYCRTTITARIHDEQQIHEGKEGQSRFSSVIIF